MFTTRAHLIAGVKQGDNMSWYQFRETYRPLILHCASRYGIPPGEYGEIEQDVLITFFKASKNFEYSPEKGKFRTYFGKLIYHCIVSHRRKHQSHDVSLDHELPDTVDAFMSAWDEEWKRHLYGQALARVRTEFSEVEMAVFDSVVLKGVSPRICAKEKSISLATVYNYSNRIKAALRAHVAMLQKEEENEEESL